MKPQLLVTVTQPMDLKAPLWVTITALVAIRGQMQLVLVTSLVMVTVMPLSVTITRLLEDMLQL
jgi:hypothetical protein